MNRRDRRASAKGRQAAGPPAEAFFRKGGEHYAAGDLHLAGNFYQRALTADPGHVRSLHQLALIAIREGRFAVAEELLARVIALDPGLVEPHNSLGVILHKQCRFEEAIQSFRRALECNPNHAATLNNMGLALQEMERHDEAIRCFRDALARERSSQYSDNLALSLRAAGRADEAVANLRTALAVDLLSADRYRKLADLLLSLGRAEDADGVLRKGIDRNPRQPSLYFLLAEIGGMTRDDPALTQMERLAATPGGLGPDDRIQLHFALGRALADAGEKEQSFRHYLEGNALKRGGMVYDEVASLGALDRIRASVTGDFLARHRGEGEPSDVPVFIVGMPRSGTTLVEQILASHREVFAAGERHYFATAIRKWLEPGEPVEAFADHLDAYDAERLRELGTAYLAAIKAAAPHARRITDKMPANFRFAGLIHAALPNARIVHVRRDPVDTCLACFSQLFVGQQSFTYDLGELGRYWLAYDRLMAHWREILPEGVMLEVQYEDLVGDFETQARRLVGHCGLDWDPACLDFHKTERSVTTASWMQVRKPIYRSSVGRWRPQAVLLRPLLEALRQGGQIP